jgi:hypothetical protein
MTNQEMIDKLRAPFPPEQIDWRIGQSGFTAQGKPWAKVLAYLTARAVQDRLDDVFGIGGWQVEYREWHNTAQICRLHVKVGDDWIIKEDGAESTDIESVKGGLSSAFKRVAVTLGIGRYLYDLTETFAECSSDRQNGWNYARTKDNKVFYWKPPTLPAWALPAKGSQKPQERTSTPNPPQTPPSPPTPPAATPSVPPPPDDSKPRPACVPNWWKPPGVTASPIGNPKVKEFYSRVDNWREVLNQRRFKIEGDRLIALPPAKLGETNPKAVGHWIDGFYVFDDSPQDDFILRAALDLAHNERMQQGPPPSDDIPF